MCVGSHIWRLAHEKFITYEFKEKLFDIEGGKQLALSIDDDLARRLAWDWLERLHHLRVDVSDISALFRVMTRVNVIGAVEILADDLGVVSALFGRQLSACATFALDG